MTTEPTGHLLRTEDGGRDLVLTRTFRAPIEDVWASLTDAERTARWFGPWEGKGEAGRNIKLQMAFEEDQPWSEAYIDVCEPPHRLVLTTDDDYGTWHLEALLSASDGGTELRFTHRLEPEAEVADVGPGWEYYLDALGAARAGAGRPDFDDYYPAMKQYYEELEPR